MNNQKSNVGKVYRGLTKHIDPEPKRTRRYVIVKDNGKNIAVSKVKSIKKFDSQNRNADCHLLEIDINYPGLSKRTGVDRNVFRYDKQTKRKLTLNNKVFTNFEFELSKSDLSKVKNHVRLRGGRNKKRDR